MSRLGSIVLSFICFFALLFIYTKLAGPLPFSIISITKSDTFQVSGTGKVTVPPDIAVVNVGVSANGATVKAAQDAINSNINQVSEAVKKLGVDSKDIQTTNYNISPVYEVREPSRIDQRIVSFQASTNLTIKVRNIEQVNPIIDAATANGANQISGISFEVEDKTKAENQARELAVSEAKRKANDASRIAGFRLGRIINYSEGFNSPGFPMPLRAGAEAADSVSTKLEPGSSEVTITVTLSYEVI